MDVFCVQITPVIKALSLLFFVILISENLTLGFYMSHGLGQMILEVSCVPPRRVSIYNIDAKGLKFRMTSSLPHLWFELP